MKCPGKDPALQLPTLSPPWEVAINSVMKRSMTLWDAGVRQQAGRALKVDLGSQDYYSWGSAVFSTDHLLWCVPELGISFSVGARAVLARSIREWASAVPCSDCLFLRGRIHTNLSRKHALQFYSHDQGLEGMCLKTYRRQNPESRMGNESLPHPPPPNLRSQYQPTSTCEHTQFSSQAF